MRLEKHVLNHETGEPRPGTMREICAQLNKEKGEGLEEKRGLG